MKADMEKVIQTFIRDSGGNVTESFCFIIYA